jgi:hypothetical protein
MPREIELKLAVPDAALAAVAAWLDANGEARGETTLLNVYLDTPARDLARQRAALRLRQKGDQKGSQWLQTLKTAGSSQGGMASRNEWECDVAGEAIELSRFPDEARAVLEPRSILARSPRRGRPRSRPSRNSNSNGCRAMTTAGPTTASLPKPRCVRSPRGCPMWRRSPRPI